MNLWTGRSPIIFFLILGGRRSRKDNNDYDYEPRTGRTIWRENPNILNFHDFNRLKDRKTSKLPEKTSRGELIGNRNIEIPT